MGSPSITEAAISFPFKIDATGNVAKTTTYEVIWADRIQAALGTIKGQRVMRSAYGSSISQGFMESIRTMSTIIEDEVIRIFSNQFPALTLDQVIVDFTESTNVLNVEVVYVLPNQQSTTTRVAMAYINNTDLIQEVNL